MFRSLPDLATAVLAGTILFAGAGYGASPASTQDGAGAPAWSAIASAATLSIWAKEGEGNGALAREEPAHPPGYYGIGLTPSEAEIAGWAIAIPPTGVNLPPGHGTVSEGEKLFSGTCAACHGTFGEGSGGYPALVGGVGSLGSSSPQRTPGSYWPYATTLFDYINRAMPFYAPHTLKPDDVYALVAWILNMDGIVKDDWIANATSLPLVKMPARGHWNWQDPRPVTHATACMADCVNPSDVKVTSDAAASKLTPRLTGPLDRMTKSK